MDLNRSFFNPHIYLYLQYCQVLYNTATFSAATMARTTQQIQHRTHLQAHHRMPQTTTPQWIPEPV